MTSGDGGEAFHTALDQRTVLDNGLVNALSSGDTLADTVRTPNYLPGWLSPFDGDDVSVPWCTVTASDSSLLGKLVLIPVALTKDRTFKTLRFSGTVHVNPTSVYVGLYRVDQIGGTHTKLWDSGDIKATISTSQIGSVYSVSMSSPVAGQANELYKIAVLMVGGSSGILNGQPAISSSGGAGAYPISPTYRSQLNAYKTGQSTLPSSITTWTLPSAASGELRAFWGALGDDPPPRSPASYYDSYYRANSNSGQGPLWVPRYRSSGSNDMGILNNAASVPDTADHISSYVAQMTTADHLVVVTTTNISAPKRIYLPLRCSDTNQCWAIWDIEHGDAQIMTSTSWGITGTQRATGSAPTSFRQMQFQAVGNIYTLSGRDAAGGIFSLDWNDSGVAHPQDSSQRIVAVGMAGVTSAITGYLDDWAARDI